MESVKRDGVHGCVTGLEAVQTYKRLAAMVRNESRANAQLELQSALYIAVASHSCACVKEAAGPH